MKLGALVLAVAIAGGCSKDPPPHGGGNGGVANTRAPAGKERGDCIAVKASPAPPPMQDETRQEPGSGSAGFAPPDDDHAPNKVVPADDELVGTCDPGLVCLSNLCVRPPPADCQAIADQLTSIDLGNYADLEERAPVVAKYKAACKKGMVSKEQGECIAKATDKFAVMSCAPLMFPEMKVESTGSTGDCDKIAELMRSVMSKSVSGVQDPQMQRMFDAAVTAMKQSCTEDGWPTAFKQCILVAGDNMDAMNKCNAQMPPDVQKKLTDRMVKLSQDQANQMSPPPPPPPPSTMPQ